MTTHFVPISFCQRAAPLISMIATTLPFSLLRKTTTPMSCPTSLADAIASVDTIDEQLSNAQGEVTQRRARLRLLRSKLASVLSLPSYHTTPHGHTADASAVALAVRLGRQEAEVQQRDLVAANLRACRYLLAACQQAAGQWQAFSHRCHAALHSLSDRVARATGILAAIAPILTGRRRGVLTARRRVAGFVDFVTAAYQSARRPRLRCESELPFHAKASAAPRASASDDQIGSQRELTRREASSTFHTTTVARRLDDWAARLELPKPP